MASFQTANQMDHWALYFNNHAQGNHSRADLHQGSNSQFMSFPQQLPMYHPAAYMADPMDPYQLMQSQSMPKESKPRLSKEEQSLLEAEFRKNRKPTTNTKKSLADEMRLEHSRVNNWFQNRRARERRERNIKAYEAQKRAERERAEAENGSQDSDLNSDRVASSAPFPDLHQSKQSSDALLDLSALDSISDDNDLSSPLFPSTEDEESVLGEPSSEDRQSVSSVSDAHLDSTSSMRLPAGQLELPMSYDSEDFMMQEDKKTTPMNKPMNKRLRSPLDVCIGRNRRPDPLAISGSRSHPGTSRAGYDAARAHAFSMRRHASVNGATSLSSPVRQSGSPIDASSVAPPTPITPLVSNPNIGCPPTVKYSSSALSDDPALTTPPDTPGMSNTFFQGIPSYGMPVSEKVMIDPSLDCYPGQFDLSGSAPNYIAGANKARVQSAAPSFVSQMAGSDSFLHDTTAQQYWSPAPVSDGSSPRGVDPFLTSFFNMNSYTGPTGYAMPNSYSGHSGYTTPSDCYMGP